MADTRADAGAQATPESAAAAGGPAAGAAAAKPAAGEPGAGAAPAKPAAGTEGREPAAPAAEPAKGKGGEPGQPAGETPKVPEKYALVIPKGDEQYVDDRARAHVEEVARASKWSNEDAQAALEEYIGNLKAEHAAFLADTKADPDYGGEHFEETQRLANLVIDRIRPTGHARRDAFLALVRRAGAFNHIEVVSFLADLGRLMAEDQPAAGRLSAGGERKTTADVLYDKTAKS